MAYRTERWETRDGDFVRLDWVDAQAPAPGQASRQALLVLFHGLEGSSDSHYARWLMAHARDLGIDGVVIHFRGCGGEPLRGPRAYHSGDSDEADWVLRAFDEPADDVDALLGKALAMTEAVLADGMAQAIARFHARPPGERARARAARREDAADPGAVPHAVEGEEG